MALPSLSRNPVGWFIHPLTEITISEPVKPATTIGIPLLLLLSRPFASRFVVLGTPFLAVLLALGSRRLKLPVLLLAGLAYLVIAAMALVPMYAGYERSDYGVALTRLRAEARPDDGVVLNGPWQDILYRRYGAGLPSGQIVASTVPLQREETVGWLRRITAEHPRVWVVDSATDAADCVADFRHNGKRKTPAAQSTSDAAACDCGF